MNWAASLHWLMYNVAGVTQLSSAPLGHVLEWMWGKCTMYATQAGTQGIATFSVNEPVLFVRTAPCHCKAMYVSEPDRNEGTEMQAASAVRSVQMPARALFWSSRLFLHLIRIAYALPC